MNSKELAIAYRVYPGISKTPALFPKDKFKMTSAGLRSLRAALDDVSYHFYAILDGCPDEYADLVTEIFRDGGTVEIVRTPKIGNAGTFALQGQFLMSQKSSDAIYFAEDDYLYRPKTFRKMLEFLSNNESASPRVDFLTPYDHPDYRLHPLHRGVHGRSFDFRGQKWTTVSTTCLTFLTRQETLKKTWPHFASYLQGATDAALWSALTRMLYKHPVKLVRDSIKDYDLFAIYARALLHSPLQVLAGRSYTLWAPTPGFATHLESTGIADGFAEDLARWSV